MTRICAIAAVLLLVTAAVSPQEVPTQPPASVPPAEAPDNDNAPVEVVREKTVYVPYKEFESVFEKTGRGMFLSYEEFLKLWQAAQPKPPEPEISKPPAAAVIRGGTYSGQVTDELARFDVTYVVEALQDGWSELALPLQYVAVESVSFDNPGVLFSSKGAGYVLILPDRGNYEAKLTFSVRVAQSPGKKSLKIGIPPVAVSRFDLTIPEENASVEVEPPMATHTTSAENGTRLQAFVGNATEVTISWTPPADAAKVGAPVFYAEQSIRAYLGERIVRLTSEFDFQVVRGEVDAFQVELPPDARLLAVRGDNIRASQPEGDVLNVRLHSPVKTSYKLKLSFERILEETPETLKLALPRARGVLRQSGWLALAHDQGLKVQVASATGLSQLDPEEVPEGLRADLRVGFRFLAPPPPLEFALERIVPLVRSQTTSVVTLDPEEDVWVGFVEYTILKAGLFRLEIRVPQRWSVDEIGDTTSVENYQIADEGQLRTVTVNLKSRALGSFRLPFRFTAPGSANTAKAATVRAPEVLGSEQDRGLLGIAVPRSLELATTAESGVRSTDVRELHQSGIMGRVGENTGTPLAYAYHDNSQQPATVDLEIESKTTEINVLAQHLVEVADGEVTVTHFLDYEILYREVDSLRLTAPSELDETLKIKSRDVKQKRTIGESTQGRTLWEVSLQGPTVGNVRFVVEQRIALPPSVAGQPNKLLVPLVEPAGDLNSIEGYVAVLRRPQGTLEIKAQPEGMELLEPSRLPDALSRGKVHTALNYVELEPSPRLFLELTRYEYEQLASTVVNLMHLKSVLSPEPRKLTTKATLLVENAASRQYLELDHPPTDQILYVSVNGKRQDRKRREESGTLIPLPPSGGGINTVVIVYEEEKGDDMGMLGSVAFRTPRVADRPDDPVPVQKIELDLHLPRDYTYLSFGGELRRDAQEIPSLLATWLRLFGGTAGARTGAAVRPPPRVEADGIVVEPPAGARFLTYRFEALAPHAGLEFRYATPEFFVFVKLVAFLAVIFGGLLLVKRVRLERLRVALAAVSIPLLLAWFQHDAMVGFFTWASTGGVVLAVVLTAPWVRDRYHTFRARRLEARLQLAPDPYLEEAESSSTGPSSPEAGSEEAQAGEAPAPAQEEPGTETPRAAKKAKKRTKKSDDASGSSRGGSRGNKS